MSDTVKNDIVEVKVPDIGGHRDVEVIEVAVKVGDVIQVDDTLITLETDKATMEVPTTAAGTVTAVQVQVGSKVSQGDVIIQLQVEHAIAKPTEASPPLAKPNELPPADMPVASEGAGPFQGQADVQCDLLVLGAGPGGYSAAFRAADLGLKTVLVERYATLGGVCLNVGCIPSKALLHTVAVVDEAKHLAARGVTFGAPAIDLDKVRQHKTGVIQQLTTGLASMAKMRRVEVLRGEGRFVDSSHVEVQTTTGSGKALTEKKQVVRFKQAIIAVGSRPTTFPFIPQDARIIDSTGALALTTIPKKMLVIGGGIIGLEMGTVYAALGTQIDIVEMAEGLMSGADRDLVKVWEKFNLARFHRVMLSTKTTAVTAKEDGIWVSFAGANAPAEAQCYDYVLVAAGRVPNGNMIGAEQAGVTVSERGFIPVDKQMRTNVPHIFAIGDSVGQPMLAHKAVHEGHVAAEVAAGHKAAFDARVIPSVAYTDPEVAWVGITEEEAKRQQIAIEKSVFPWAASGRAIANGRSEGYTKLLFDPETHRLLGGGIVGTHAGDLIGEICLAIEMGCDALDIAKTIHPHPTLCESIGLSAEVFEGICTDLPPRK